MLTAPSLNPNKTTQNNKAAAVLLTGIAGAPGAGGALTPPSMFQEIWYKRASWAAGLITSYLEWQGTCKHDIAHAWLRLTQPGLRARLAIGSRCMLGRSMAWLRTAGRSCQMFRAPGRIHRTQLRDSQGDG